MQRIPAIVATAAALLPVTGLCGCREGRHPTGSLPTTTDTCAVTSGDYIVTDVGTGHGHTRVFDVNCRGQVAGLSATHGTRAFLWHEGTVVDLGTPPDRPGYFEPRRVNSLGQVAGVVCTPSSSGQVVGGLSTRAVLGQFDHGTWRITELVRPRDSVRESEATDVNDAGQVAGWVAVPGGSRAFVWQNNVMLRLDTLCKGGSSWAHALDSSVPVQVVGAATTAAGEVHAVLWEGEAIRDLGTLPGHTRAYACAINAAGQVVGCSRAVGEEGLPVGHPFLWENGQLTDLGAPNGSTLAIAADINDDGHVVGAARMSNGLYHAFLWQKGSGWTDLNDVVAPSPQRQLEFAQAISDNGLIAANGGVGIRPPRHAFLLTPRAASPSW